MNDKILKQVGNYYSDKILKNGATPQGVDWNSVESQELRFEMLSGVIKEDRDFSVLDYGCGFGSMYDYFKKKYSEFNYVGFDIADEMIVAAEKRNISNKDAIWFTKLQQSQQCDYTIASGIFNVKLENSDSEWLEYVLDTLNTLNQHSNKGFSFNVLTKYSDKEYMKDYLYYADPLFLFDYCKTHFSRNVALLHDYNLYEFTMIVRK